MDADFLAKGKGKGKQDKGRGKGKSKGKDKGKNNWNNQSSHKNSWGQQSWNQQSWQKNPNDSKSKGKGKKGQDKGKGKGDQGKGRKVANFESDAWTQEQQPAAATGDQPEPEVTALFALEEDDLVNRLDRLKNDPEVRHKLGKVLKEAYEKAYGEVLDLDSPEEIESDETPLNEKPGAGGLEPGMEVVFHHWEVSQKTLMPF